MPAVLAGDAFAEVVAAALLATALAFGGGSRGAGDLVVHLFALPAFALGVTRWQLAAASRTQRLFLYWLLAALVVAAAQLLPLPASLFAALPQRAQVLADLHRAGLDPAWLPMTVDTWGTVRALLAVITFAAAWLLVTTLGPDARVRLLKLMLLLGVAMALLGFAQAGAGEHSRLRPYDYHHPIGAIGTFANRNHFADLMAMLVPLALAFAFAAHSARQLPRAAAWFAVAVLLFLASALSFSRAGILLTAAASAFAFIALLKTGAERWRRQVLPILAIGVAALAVAVYAWDGIANRMAQDPLEDLRWQYVTHGLDALRAWLPWGSGLGSFRDVYAPFEPVAAMQQVHALHAHNDLLEVAIEAGLPGLVLVAGFLALLLKAFLAAFRKRGGRGPLLSTIIPAAAFAVFVPLLHSFVDYPLRTLSVATVIAILLAVLMAAHATRVE
ncbi:O-antigen ligase family protein [Lysobacter niabensis]|uniref:O-antigen ligase family protein n=1 Tax=Agrilutibacter niabensis TaxID=380628 RepID=UPI0036080226